MCALEAEAGPLNVHLGGRRDVRVVVSGMGPQRAASALQDVLNEVHPALVIAAGFAGALAPDLRISAVFHFDEIRDADTGITYGMPRPDGKRLVTVAQPACTAAEKAELRQKYQADAVDMETAAIARLCTQRDIPWRAVRAITDTADQSIPPELMTLVDARGRSRCGSAIGLLLRRPGLLGAMLRLGRISKLAAANLAQTLDGDLQFKNNRT